MRGICWVQSGLAGDPEAMNTSPTAEEKDEAFCICHVVYNSRTGGTSPFESSRLANSVA